MTKNNKRWQIVRKSTGRIVRGFITRDDARDYKRNNGGSFRILDTERMEFVR